MYSTVTLQQKVKAVRMVESGRKQADVARELMCEKSVIMFIDNCTVHNLPAIRLDFLPPNTTSVLQPMDQGIIKHLKVLYRSRLLSRVVLCYENKTNYNIALLAVLHIFAHSWEAVKGSTIANSFRHAGFCKDTTQVRSTSTVGITIGNDDRSADARALVADLRSSGMTIPASVKFEMYAEVDECAEFFAEMTDGEIVSQVLELPAEGSDDDDASAIAAPSTTAILAAVDTLGNVYCDNMTLAEIHRDAISQSI
ncbi:jerky protein homolog-like [Ornithodoros turicata]|uniref:jerky protein homolog-like n=1 Tax=Ornithodoros turicata TaxID=34597 RepID=UPI003138CC3E